MMYAREQDRGNVDEDTDVFNPGEFVAYAEARFGPWTVEFTRGRRGFTNLLDRESKFSIEGPLLNEESRGSRPQAIRDIFDSSCHTWDYMERADEEVHTPS